jgi:diguanylate cyclase (GGDEF) domain
MMLNLLPPNMERRYAIAGSAIGALAPMAWTSGSLPSGAHLYDLFSVIALSPTLGATTLLSSLTLGYLAARAGRRLDDLRAKLEEERVRITRLHHTAFHDALTGLSNRYALGEDVAALVARKEAARRHAVVMLLDLDRFKFINDTMGHYAGDEVLLALTRRLKAYCGERARVYRLGGDEFVILMEGMPAEAEVDAFAAEMARAVFRPVPYGATEIATSGSIGISWLVPEENCLSTALKRADLALYHAKETPGASHRFFTAEMENDYRLRREMETAMREGIGTGAFRIEYQPIVETRGLVPTAFSARLRWTHPVYGDVSPDMFLPLAREIGLIALIDRWLLKQAIADVAGWPQATGIAVRLSCEELASACFATRFAEDVRAAGIDPRRFIVDIVGEALEPRAARGLSATVKALRALGVRVSASDHVGGQLDLQSNGRPQVDTWRIDLASLTKEPGERPDRALTAIVVDLARSLGVGIRFEGVDSDEDLAFVRAYEDVEAEGRFSGAGMGAAQAASFARAMHRVADKVTRPQEEKRAVNA